MVVVIDSESQRMRWCGRGGNARSGWFGEIMLLGVGEVIDVVVWSLRAMFVAVGAWM